MVAETKPPPLPTEGEHTFLAHELRALRTALHEQNRLTREMVEVLRDLRDELAMAREERRAAAR